MKKQKRIRRLAPCPNYDVEKIESWLQDMAREGWLLEKDGCIFGVLSFLKDAPRTLRYRLEPKEPGTGFGDVPDMEAQELCKEYGWEYVDSYGDFFIYRSVRSDAREMNTDLQVQAAALKAGSKSSSFALVLDMVLVSSLIGEFFQLPFRALVHLGLAYHLIHGAAMIWASIDLILRTRHLNRLHRKLKANIPLDHNKPWRKGASFHIFSKFAYALVILLLFGVMFGSCSRSVTLEDTPTADYPGEPPFVASEDILEGSEFTAQSFLHSFNAYTVDSTFFAPQIIEWKEYGAITTADAKTYDGSLIVTYYETRWDWLAEGLMDDLYRDAEENKHFSGYPAPDIEADQVLCYWNIYPTILIRQGNILIKATVGLEYQDEYLLEKWAQRMSQMLIRE